VWQAIALQRATAGNPPAAADGGSCRAKTWRPAMPKLKTNKGAAKRFRRTAKGFKAAQSPLNHILTKKSSKRKRKLGPMNMVDDSDVRSVRKMLPYA
jgi:large subunit ribosomal protein L35